ncbi:MAG: hypothetical protein KDD63_22360 [Bacteroidetes bacterium]|nr:hypothetical protein [Bacteroidota bacterium]MCB0844062.1 hypothetical protein [Bacteroidota bacterium]MCB0854989.1 hypothetical protein [Bacteroidota bacterium]
MNFISHFYLDRNLEDSFFFVGVSTPDLVSVFDRNVRLKEGRMPLLMENEATVEEISFYNGVIRHFEVDKVFHTSDFFYRETDKIKDLLHDTFGTDQVYRGFFVAHVLFELILDKILISHDSNLLPSFYEHLERYPIKEYVRLTEWVTHTPMPAYDAFLKRFIKKKYLYDYADWEHILYIIRKIVQGVGINQFEYLHSPGLISILDAYEKELAIYCFDEFSLLNEQLIKV